MCTLDDFKKEEEKVFNDGEYTVWAEKIQELKPGDIKSIRRNRNTIRTKRTITNKT